MLTGASTTPWPNHWRTRIAAASTICSSAGTTARRPGWLWLRQSPAKPNSRHMLEHIERLKAWQALDLPTGIERLVHQNRLLKITREGGQMTPADLAKFEPQRRYATLVALATEGMATRHRRNHRPARPHPG